MPRTTRAKQIASGRPLIDHRARPAEATGGIVGIATAVAALLGASTQAVAIVGTCAGLVPAVVTYLVAHGGISGTLRAVWRGHS